MLGNYPVIEVEGDAYECGYGYGHQGAERIAQSIENYRPSFQKQGGLDWSQVRERAREYAVAIQESDPDIVAEIKGIAAGARLEVEDIVAINCRTEILYGKRPKAQPAPVDCTTIIALPEATKSGSLLLGKNSDWYEDCLKSIVVLKARQKGKPAQVNILEAGQVGRDGFNEAGLAHCGNLLTSNVDKGQVGVPVAIIRRRVLNSSHFYQAIDAVARPARGGSSNYIVADRGGVAVNIEASPENVYTLFPERGLLTHTNHFKALEAVVSGVAKYHSADSLYRDFRARQLLEPKIGSITVEDIEAVLRDHVGKPRSICRHTDPETMRPVMTVYSLVLDMGTMVMHFAGGQPCETDYLPVRLPA